MNQPELGLKVAELRQQKGMTQEQLAERCEVSPRTIQRIESGEVDPRAYTLHTLGEVLGFDFGEENAPHENFWLAILHLSSMFCVFIVPLLLWSWMKNRSYKIDRQGRQVLNFQITMLLAGLVFLAVLMLFPAAILLAGGTVVDQAEEIPWILLTLVCVPAPLVLLGIFCMIQGAVNALRSLTDQPVRYALSIPFVK
jgi:uncharacterized Tic20 family protein/DNA-binding Xre family transcriptional regulator